MARREDATRARVSARDPLARDDPRWTCRGRDPRRAKRSLSLRARLGRARDPPRAPPAAPPAAARDASAQHGAENFPRTVALYVHAMACRPDPCRRPQRRGPARTAAIERAHAGEAAKRRAAQSLHRRAPLPSHRPHFRTLPGLRDRSHPAARVWWARRSFQHAVADDSRGEREGPDGARRLQVRFRRATNG